MSTFLRHSGRHYADTMRTFTTIPLRRSFGTKIHVSPDNQFVFSISGITPNAAQVELLMKSFRHVVETIVCKDADSLQLNDFWKTGKEIEESLPGVWGFMVSTKEFCVSSGPIPKLAIAKTTIDIYRTRDDQPVTVGSNAFGLIGLILSDMEPLEAYNYARMIETSSGGDLEYVECSELEDFVVKGAK